MTGVTSEEDARGCCCFFFFFLGFQCFSFCTVPLPPNSHKSCSSNPFHKRRQMVSWRNDGPRHRRNSWNRVPPLLTHLYASTIYFFTFLFAHATTSSGLCKGAPLWRNWLGLGPECIPALAMKLTSINASLIGMLRVMRSLHLSAMFLFLTKERQ